MSREIHSAGIESTMRRNTRLYYIYSAVREAHGWIYFVVWVVFLREVRGLNLLQIGIIDAAFWVSMVLGEVPTGVVADKVGRRVSLVIGAVLDVVGLLVFIIFGQFGALVVANVILGIGFTFHSGAGNALLFESLQAIGKEDSYTAVLGRVMAVSQAAAIGAGLAASAIVTVGLIYPYVAGCGLAVMMVLTVFLMREPPREKVTGEDKDTDAKGTRESYQTILLRAVRVLRSERGAFAIVLFTAVAGTITYLMLLVIQPFTASIGSTASIVAIAVVATNVGGIAGSLLAGKLTEEGLGKRLAIFSPIMIAALLFITASGNQLLVILIPCILTSFVVSLIMPMLGTLLNKRIPDAVRATVLSFQSVINTALLTASDPVVGALVDARGPRFGFLFIGGVAVVYAIYHLFRFARVYDKIIVFPGN